MRENTLAIKVSWRMRNGTFKRRLSLSFTVIILALKTFETRQVRTCGPQSPGFLKSFCLLMLCVCPDRIITSHMKDTCNNQIMKFYGFSISLYDTAINKLNDSGLSNTTHCKHLPKKTKVTQY